MDQVKHSIVMLQIAKVIIFLVQINNINFEKTFIFTTFFYRILHSLPMVHIELHLYPQILISLV